MPAHRKEVKIQTQTIVTITPKNNYSFFNHKKAELWLGEIKNPFSRFESGIFSFGGGRAKCPYFTDVPFPRVDAFPSDRVDIYILFSKLDQFTPDEIERIKKTRKTYKIHDDTIYTNRAIMLSDRELEPYHLYEQTSKEFTIDRYAVGVDELVRNTVNIFIEPVPIPKPEK